MGTPPCQQFSFRYPIPKELVVSIHCGRHRVRHSTPLSPKPIVVTICSAGKLLTAGYIRNVRSIIPVELTARVTRFKTVPWVELSVAGSLCPLDVCRRRTCDANIALAMEQMSQSSYFDLKKSVQA